MSESSKPPTSATKAPSHVAYHVREGKTGDAFWTRICSAWSHADGKGFSTQIETVPLYGRISLLPSEKAEKSSRAGLAARPL